VQHIRGHQESTWLALFKPKVFREYPMRIAILARYIAPKLRLVLSAGILLILLTNVAAEQSTDEKQLKVAFLANLAKFVEWPPNAFKNARDPIICCILGDGPFGRVLEETASRQIIDNRKFIMHHISNPSQSSGCHMLFVSEDELKRWRSMAAQLMGRGILTVGETLDFTSEGGVVSFKLNGDKAQIQINLDEAEKEKLKFSSKLLSLSKIDKK
jgi:hypothetical protein